jgi:heme exporter protein B
VPVRARVSPATRFLGGAAAIWAKELRCEWRSRFSIGASLVFAAATLAVLSFAAGPAAARPEWAAPLLWVAILFSAVAALGHAFAREVDAGTWDLLRQCASPGETLLGKWLAAGTLLGGLSAFLAVAGAVLVAPRVGHPAGVAAMLALGTTGLAIALPLVSALLAHARRHGGLAAALALPLVVPGLFASVSGTRRALEGEWPSAELRVLAGFAGAIAIAGWMLFRYVWDD